MKSVVIYLEDGAVQMTTGELIELNMRFNEDSIKIDGELIIFDNKIDRVVIK